MQLPPGPQSPTFVQLMRWIFSPMSLMSECTDRYGDIFTLKFSRQRPEIVFVSNPQALQQILTQDTRDDFSAPGELNDLFKYLLGDRSVITLSGKEHQRQRQLMMPAFHGDRMRTYRQIIDRVTAETIENIPVGHTFDVRETTQAITLGVMMAAVFGLNTGARAAKLEQLLVRLLDRGSSPLSVTMLYLPLLQQEFFGPWATQMRLQREVDDTIYAEIQERHANPDASRTDILSMLMAARDELGTAMTDRELRDELMTLLVAGHETTATALAWALYWIHKLPTVKEKLLDEIDALGENSDPNAILKLPYLDAVCNESLRIYPVAMLTLPRVAKKTVSIAGYELPAGTVILGSIYSTHQREDLYPQPQEFRPERFLERQFSPFEFLPFGGGARRCIGSAFALCEMKLALVGMLSHRELELVDLRDLAAKRRGL
ncbi:MAG: cytochrome P450, partial [Chamaesiphon sp.]|nr:cytochrome P450 [Chamaesiphon sp.]